MTIEALVVMATLLYELTRLGQPNKVQMSYILETSGYRSDWEADCQIEHQGDSFIKAVSEVLCVHGYTGSDEIWWPRSNMSMKT
jgi:hypothetical protein